MSDLTLIVMALSGTIGVIGYLIKRAITQHDAHEVTTQAMIAENAEKILANARTIAEAARQAEVVAERQHQVMTDILTEAKLTNHRITVLVATEIADRRHHGSHQQRGAGA
jgi:hypothetical protein